MRNRFVIEMGDTETLDFPLQASMVGPLWQLPSEDARAAFMPVWAGQAAPLIRELSASQLIEKLVAEAQSVLAQKGGQRPLR
jgi:nitronate monooxygenase